MVEQQMRTDDLTTLYQLHLLLVSEGYQLSINTNLHCRLLLGCTFRGRGYCQMIWEASKLNRYEWALEHVDDPFKNIIYTDECIVQLEAHPRICCTKIGEPPKPKPKYSQLAY